MTVAPWGDLILCEDGPGEQFLVGVTPTGKTYKFAKNSMNTSEFAGATFSPDGSTLFVNLQSPGMTLAIIDLRRHPLVVAEPKGKLITTLGQIKGTELLQNYPNPFNLETWIPFRLAKDAHVTINIYSGSGDFVRTLGLGYKREGEYRHQSKAAYWDGRNDSGEMVSSGVYFYQMQVSSEAGSRSIGADKFTAIKKLVVRK